MLRRFLFLCLLFIYAPARSQDSSTVLFEFDRFELSATAEQTLDKILAKPNLFSVVIIGHADQLGSVEYNERLSLKRANAVRDYLAKKGVAADKIKLVKAMGETAPAIALLDAVSRQANRRVVVIADYEVFARDSIIIEKKQTAPVPDTTPVKPAQPPPKKLITEITDTATRVGANIVLRNINFYGGRHVFLPESYTALVELLEVMRQVPTLHIEIQGHICCQSGPGDGLDMDTGEPFLSYNRARAVFEYLVENGIDRKRMTYKGFGHRQPIVLFESTEAERTMNRRVEIKILKK